MIGLRPTFFPCMLPLSCKGRISKVSWGAVFFIAVSAASTLCAQSPSVSDRKALVKDSSLIVSGVVETERWVVNQTKMALQMKRAAIPSPADFVIGRIFTIRVHELVKRSGRLSVGTTVKIFVSGFSPREGAPTLTTGQRYFVLLAPLSASSGDLENTTLYDPRSQSGKSVPFDRRSVYTIVGDEYGAIQETPPNQRAIQEIRAAVRSSRH